MSEDYASYQVHGSQLRYAKAMLDANGIPISAINRQGDVYVIVIPAMYAGFNHATAAQPQRSRKPWWKPTKRTWVTLAMVAVVGVGVYMVLSGGITIAGVSVPAVELPKIDNPLTGVNATLDQTAASVNHAADAARNAAVTFAYAVGSLIVLGGLWAFRGPLAMAARGLSGAGRGLAGAGQALGKAVKRG